MKTPIQVMMKQLISALFIAALFILPSYVHAAFSGANGKILFIQTQIGSSATINTINPDGSDQQTIPIDLAGVSEGSWSPDGTKIAFSGIRDLHDPQDGYRIYTINADGGGLTQITNNNGGFSPAWSPDGTKIVYLCALPGSNEVCTMDADGSNQTQLTHDSAHLNQSNAAPAWSPDGMKIAWSRGISGTTKTYVEIYAMNADGSNQVSLTHDAEHPEETNAYPSWSPDGAKIVFLSDRDGPFYEIYTMNVDGSNRFRITANDASDSYPSWSPDGTKIVFMSDRDGHQEVYTANTDGSDQTRVTFSQSASDNLYPDWQSLISISNVLPISSFTFQPSNPKVGDMVTFDASGSYDPDGRIVLYGWDWNSDGITDVYSVTPSVQYDGFPAGTATTTLTVTDDKGGVTTNTALLHIEPNNRSTGTASVLDAFCSVFGGWWCGSSVVAEENDMKTIDEWLRDRNGDNSADTDTKPYDWLKGTKCAGVGTATEREGCLVSALNTQFKNRSGQSTELTYRAYILSVITEQKMVENAFVQQHVDTYKLYLKRLADWLPLKDVIDLFFNDSTTEGIRGFLIAAAPNLPYATADLFVYGTSFLSFGMEIKKINDALNDLSDSVYHEVFVCYLSRRSARNNNNDHEYAWGICNADTALGSLAKFSEATRAETKDKFNEWYNKYQPHFRAAEGFSNQFKQNLKNDIEKLITYAIKNPSK